MDVRTNRTGNERRLPGGEPEIMSREAILIGLPRGNAAPPFSSSLKKGCARCRDAALSGEDPVKGDAVVIRKAQSNAQLLAT